jgi:hypothetical protein
MDAITTAICSARDNHTELRRFGHEWAFASYNGRDWIESRPRDFHAAQDARKRSIVHEALCILGVDHYAAQEYVYSRDITKTPLKTLVVLGVQLLKD